MLSGLHIHVFSLNNLKFALSEQYENNILENMWLTYRLKQCKQVVSQNKHMNVLKMTHDECG